MRTLSLAFSKSGISTSFLFWRAASSAASVTRLASSAPEKPGVPRARTLRSTLGASGMRRACTRRISSRPFTSGRGTTTWRSKRPGRSSAGSRTSGRLVAAMRMTPSFVSNPSISTSNWFSVCSRSSWPPPRPAPRCRPTASISSMKMMHGAFFLPCTNRSRTREAPTPTNISTKSEPLMEKNGTPASPAMARASRVLPVAAELGELLGVLQKGDDLFELVLGFVDAGDVAERDLVGVLAQHLGAALAERHGLAATDLHLAHEEDPHTDQQHDREPLHEGDDVPGVAGFRLGGNLHVLAAQRADQVGVVGRVGLEPLAVVELAADVL